MKTLQKENDKTEQRNKHPYTGFLLTSKGIRSPQKDLPCGSKVTSPKKPRYHVMCYFFHLSFIKQYIGLFTPPKNRYFRSFFGKFTHKILKKMYFQTFFEPQKKNTENHLHSSVPEETKCLIMGPGERYDVSVKADQEGRGRRGVGKKISFFWFD